MLKLKFANFKFGNLFSNDLFCLILRIYILEELKINVIFLFFKGLIKTHATRTSRQNVIAIGVNATRKFSGNVKRKKTRGRTISSVQGDAPSSFGKIVASTTFLVLQVPD